jgi:hypothetical protein
VTDLRIVPAESHRSGNLRRITYEPNDGTRAASGIEAIARALEHIHFGWMLIGCVLRIPGVRQGVQLLADASGASPRRVSACPPEVAAVVPENAEVVNDSGVKYLRAAE